MSTYEVTYRDGAKKHLAGRLHRVKKCELRHGMFTRGSFQISAACPRIKVVVYKGEWIIKRSDHMPFSYVHKDYDGPEDNRRGFGNSVQDCAEWIENFWGKDA